MPQYLGRLAANATSIINARDYGRTVYDLATRRQLIMVGEEMVNAAYDSPVGFDPAAQIESVESQLYALAEQGRYGQGFLDFSVSAARVESAVQAAIDRGGRATGLTTGFADLDSKLGGLQPTDLIIIAGRPSMGKTAFATNIAFNIAQQHRARSLGGGSHRHVDCSPMGFFSMEMSGEQLAERVLAGASEIPSDRLRRGAVDQAEAEHFMRITAQLKTVPLFVDPTGGLSIAQLAGRARKLKRQKGIGLFVVDYLQLVSDQPAGPRITACNRSRKSQLV